MANFLQRFFVSTLAIPLFLFCLYSAHNGPWKVCFLIGMLAISMTAVWEFLQLICRTGAAPLSNIILGGTGAYIAALFAAEFSPLWSTAPLIVLVVTLACIFACQLYRGEHPIQTSASSFLPLAYLTLPLGTMISIVYFFPVDSLQDGRWWLLFLIVVTKGSDMAAYLVGETMGRRLLAPKVSPKKTYEGAVAGFLAAIVIGAVMPAIADSLFYHTLEISSLSGAILAAILGIAAQFGDLTESLLKREVGIKNSSHLPGLGGILDIVDALVFSAPLLYIFLKIQYGSSL